MEEGTVENIQIQDEENYKRFQLTIDGNTASFFDDHEVELGDIEEGDRVEYETETNRDGYENIVSLGLVRKDDQTEGRDSDVRYAVLNARKTLASIHNPDSFDPDRFQKETRRVAEETLEIIESLNGGESQ